MTTFNVDSLDFVDDEEARFGAGADYSARYSSSNGRFELEDLTAGTVAHVPQGTSTDLVGGKFAETVSEGKALADDGNVYDSIQDAENNASSWVKVGPGTFKESVTIDTAGLTLKGSGDRTVINGGIENDNSNVTVQDILVKFGDSNNRAVKLGVSNTLVQNVTVKDCDIGIGASIITNCTIKNISTEATIKYDILTNTLIDGVETFDGAKVRESDSITAFNTITNIRRDGVYITGSDAVIYGNVISNTDRNGIKEASGDGRTIIVNNRLINTSGIDFFTSGNVIQDNLITE